MQAQEVLSQYAILPEDEIPLFKAALSLALIEYPNLDINRELTKISHITEEARKRIKTPSNPDEPILLLNDYFFNELGFRGNIDDYYNPRNSFLNEVLDRRVGIPITISVIYLEVAWRLGLNVYGVGFPGHFLIGYKGRNGDKYFDPFNRGMGLGKEDMQKILDSNHQGSMNFKESFLDPTGKRSILVRMLNNLRGVYLNNVDLGKTLKVLDCIIILNPNSAPEIRERGLVNYHLRNYEAAIEDLSRYLELSPKPSDTQEIQGYIEQSRSIIEKLR